MSDVKCPRCELEWTPDEVTELRERIAELETAYKRGWVSEDTDKLFRDVSVCFDLVWNMQCADGFHPVVAKNFQVYLQRIKDAYRGVEVKRNEAMNVGIELEERVAELKANQIPGRCADCRWCYDDLDIWRCMTGGHRRVKPTDFCSSWEARDRNKNFGEDGHARDGEAT